jgi:WD40 repeat protein
MRLWEANSGQMVKRYGGYTAAINAISFSPDGRSALSASGNYLLDEKNQIVVKNGQPQFTDCTLKLWDVPDGAEPRQISNQTKPIYAAAWAPSGKEVVSGGWDPQVRWVGIDGKEHLALPLTGIIYSLAISPDEQLLASTDSGARVIVRDRASGKVLHEWTLQEQPRRVVFAADSRHLAVTLDTGVIYILRLQTAGGKS